MTIIPLTLFELFHLLLTTGMLYFTWKNSKK